MFRGQFWSSFLGTTNAFNPRSKQKQNERDFRNSGRTARVIIKKTKPDLWRLAAARASGSACLSRFYSQEFSQKSIESTPCAARAGSDTFQTEAGTLSTWTTMRQDTFSLKKKKKKSSTPGLQWRGTSTGPLAQQQDTDVLKYRKHISITFRKDILELT